MKILATRIAKELRTAKHCAVYEPELTRVWPTNKNRQAKIALFAKSTAGDFATTVMDFAQSSTKNRL